MKSLLFCIFLSIGCVTIYAQKDSITVKDVGSDSIYKVNFQDLIKVEVKEKPPKPDVISWYIKNKLGFDVSEVAFVNWNAGGTNSVSGLLSAEFVRNFKREFTVWDNRFAARFGVNSQAGVGFRKTDDLIEFNTAFGYRKNTSSNWYTSANLNFKTQFGHGYAYNGDEKVTKSTFMAPAYLLVGVGTIYSHNVEKFTAFLSPLTLKSTFVLNQSLANAGAFGVTPAEYDVDGNLIKEGKTTRIELGILARSSFEMDIYKNVTLKNIVSFYTDYVNNFGNFDVDWEIAFSFVVNEYIRAVFGSHLRYDDDIKYTENIDGKEVQISGAKVQWKQILGIGVVYEF